jgi:hypothetical protein
MTSYECHITLKICNSVNFSDSGGKIKEQQLWKVWNFMDNLQINQQQAQGIN